MRIVGVAHLLAEVVGDGGHLATRVVGVGGDQAVRRGALGDEAAAVVLQCSVKHLAPKLLFSTRLNAGLQFTVKTTDIRS